MAFSIRRSYFTVGACLFLTTLAHGAPGDTTLVSVNLAGGLSGNASIPEPSASVVSANGRFVAFSSGQSTIVAGDTNSNWDVFVRDLATGTTERISVDSNGRQANGHSDNAAISADGRFVAFQSSATNLAADDRPETIDIFVRDRQNKTTTRLNSLGGTPMNASSRMPAISGDGRYVSFLSAATNLVADDTNGVSDLYVQELLTSATQRVNVSSAGVQSDRAPGYHTLNGDGSRVVFDSLAAALIADDTNDSRDVFVHDLRTRVTERVSVSSAGLQGNRDSSAPTITADGRYVTFWSDASNLAPDRTLSFGAVYMRDLLARTTELVGVRTDGSQIPAVTAWPSISNDGRYVVFEYLSNGPWQVMLRDRWNNTLEWVSLDLSGSLGNSDSYRPRISGDGSTVVFGSAASGLVPESGPGWSSSEVYTYEVGRSPGSYSLYLRPLSINYGQVALGTTLKKGFTLTNAGTAPLPISTIELLGPNRSQYVLRSFCGEILAVRSHCWISVSFLPTSIGYKQANLHVVAGGINRHRALRGTGLNY